MSVGASSAAMNNITTVSLKITGRVQGVWYRGWTVKTALALDLVGWVRNRADGSVEILMAGSDDKLDEMIVACHRGPPAARVDDVIEESADGQDIPASGFVQRATV